MLVMACIAMACGALRLTMTYGIAEKDHALMVLYGDDDMKMVGTQTQFAVINYV